MKVEIFLLIFFLSFVFAGVVEDVFPGEVLECDVAKTVFDANYSGYEVPEGVPFSDDIFNIYIDENFFVSVILEDKKISGLECEEGEEVSYNVYLTSGLIKELVSGEGKGDVVDFYNRNRESGDLKIEAVGFGKKIKLGFINFGLKIAGWFS